MYVVRSDDCTSTSSLLVVNRQIRGILNFALFENKCIYKLNKLKVIKQTLFFPRKGIVNNKLRVIN